MKERGSQRARRGATRRGLVPPPRRRRREEVAAAPVGRGFEGLLAAPAVEPPTLRSLLAIEHLPELLPESEPAPSGLGLTRRESILLSAIVHLLFVLLLVVQPDFLADAFRSVGPTPETAPEEKDRLVLFVEPEPPPAVAAPPSAASPPPPPAPQDGGMILPKATKPPPEDERREFMNDLPFSRGNTDEFYTDEELKEPGEEGEPGEKLDEEKGAAEEAQRAEGDNGEEARRLARLLPGDLGLGLAEALRRPGRAGPAPLSEPFVRPGEEGERGEGGPFADIRRFLRDKRFDNPEGGLVTGRDTRLYYNDKGADFVPWLKRMIAEVRRNWLVPQSALFQAGHVAVGVSVRRDGQIVHLEILVPSGVSGFDNAAVGALKAARLLPLPADYPDERFDIIIVFWYNERPYDIF